MNTQPAPEGPPVPADSPHLRVLAQYVKELSFRNAGGAAAQAYERAFALGIPPGRSTQGVANYNLAIAYAHLGRHDEAFARLAGAVEQGITARAQYADDDDLAPLRGDARFAEMLARLQP